METLRVEINVQTLEPGHHIAREVIARRPLCVVDLPRAECMEPRPDWGEYFPLVTFPAIERALRRRGYFPPLAEDERYSYGIVGDTYGRR